MATVSKEVLQGLVQRHKALRNDLYKLFNSNIQNAKISLQILEPTGKAAFKTIEVNDNIEVLKIYIEELFMVVNSQLMEAEELLKTKI